jgi:hypothetical protein
MTTQLSRPAGIPVKAFRWRTHDGREMLPSEMGTQHLVYSLRMVWNHLCPPHLVIPGGKRWFGIDRWPGAYLKAAIEALCLEASQRPDLSPEHRRILTHLATHSVPTLT